MGNFRSDEHALTTGIVAGLLLKNVKEAFGEDAKVAPVVHGGDYRQQIMLTWGGRSYMIDVSEIVIEEDPV